MFIFKIRKIQFMIQTHCKTRNCLTRRSPFNMPTRNNESETRHRLDTQTITYRNQDLSRLLN